MENIYDNCKHGQVNCCSKWSPRADCKMFQEVSNNPKKSLSDLQVALSKTKFEHKNLIHTLQHGDGSVMVWGCLVAAFVVTYSCTQSNTCKMCPLHLTHPNQQQWEAIVQRGAVTRSVPCSGAPSAVVHAGVKSAIIRFPSQIPTDELMPPPFTLNSLLYQRILE